MNYDEILIGRRFFIVKNYAVRLVEAKEYYENGSLRFWKCSRILYNNITNDSIEIVSRFDNIFLSDYDAYLYLNDELYELHRSIKDIVARMENGEIKINKQV